MIVRICEEVHVAVLSGVPERKCSRPLCCLGQICVCFLLGYLQIVSFHDDIIFETWIFRMTGFADHRFCWDLRLVVRSSSFVRLIGDSFSDLFPFQGPTFRTPAIDPGL